MKIAVCFWGLTRSLKYTINSINEQLSEMKKFGEVTTFMHTYRLNRPYSNLWGKEEAIVLDPNEYKLLDPDHFIWDDQDEVSSKLDFKAYRTFPDDIYKTNYQTIDNFIIAMYSQKRVTELMLRHNKKQHYDYVVFMRPDVIFDSKPRLKYFQEVNDHTIVTPQFGHWHDGGIKINDRYAICTPKVAEIYGRRLMYLLEYSKHKPIYTEVFLYDLMKAFKIKIYHRWICFNRVRADGRINPDCKTDY